MSVALSLSFECGHVAFLCRIPDEDENRAQHESEIPFEIEKHKL
jgi:hypothetical protein